MHVVSVCLHCSGTSHFQHYGWSFISPVLVLLRPFEGQRFLITFKGSQNESSTAQPNSSAALLSSAQRNGLQKQKYGAL